MIKITGLFLAEEEFVHRLSHTTWGHEALVLCIIIWVESGVVGWREVPWYLPHQVFVRLREGNKIMYFVKQCYVCCCPVISPFGIFLAKILGWFAFPSSAHFTNKVK